MTRTADQLRSIKNFDQLIPFLEEDLEWPFPHGRVQYDFEDLTFQYSAEEVGLEAEYAAKIKSIHQLRPLVSGQPWGIFFVEFENKKLPIVVLRRILSHLVLKKRKSANPAERARWNAGDLIFISAFAEEGTLQREIAFAHFHQDPGDQPTLRVLGWDGGDTPLKLEHIAQILKQRLSWPNDTSNHELWRKQWAGAFRYRIGQQIQTADLLAQELARVARNIRDAAMALMRVESSRGPLRKMHEAFRTALIHDLDQNGFADTYAQTITYGLLTAAISRTDRSAGAEGTFVLAEDIHNMVPITNPFLKEMLESFLKVGGRGSTRHNGLDFDELGVQEVVELLRSSEIDLPAVLEDFGNRNPGEDPVIRFYEDFLRAYNKKLKIQRGVFYTPQSVVSFIVRSVHELLQREFGLRDGLASTVTWGEMSSRMAAAGISLTIPDGTPPDSYFVVILDPATGTATFLVEAIDLIFRTLKAKWKEERMSAAKQHEAWNKYVPESLLPRLHGYELMMAPYAIAHMKIGLKLYETGYDFSNDERVRVYLTNALEPATDSKAQREFEDWAPALAHEARAVNTVKRTQRFTVFIGNPPYSNFGQLNKIPFILDLLEDYKRGLNEKKLNLDDDYLKFLRLSQYMLECSGCGIVGMITNSSFLDGLVHRKMRERFLVQFTAGWIADLHGNSRRGDTAPDGSQDENVFDIQQGVCISLWMDTASKGSRSLRYCEKTGNRESKYAFLGGHTASSARMDILKPQSPHFLFVPQNVSKKEEYEEWIPLGKVFSVLGSGLNTDRDDLCIDFDKAKLSERMKRVFSGNVDAEFIETFNLRPSSSYDPATLAAKQDFDPKAIRVCTYRPFDFRNIYYKPGFTSRPVFEVQGHMLRPNIGLLVCRQSKEPFAVLATRNISTHKIVAVYDRTSLAPLWLYPTERPGQRTIKVGDSRAPGLSPMFTKALALRLQLRCGDHGLPNGITAEDVFNYVYAVFHSPEYRARYAEFLKSDYPRVPLPGSLKLFRALARLGCDLVSLHVMDSPKLEVPLSTYTGPRKPAVEKISFVHNVVWLDRGMTRGFKGVPEAVWNFHIGGYQVCDKWLKDRRDRTLSEDEIAHYQKIVVGLRETIKAMSDIDHVIEQHGGWPDAFASASE
jgi:hypothetical protein